jgi:hypothetical protein
MIRSVLLLLCLVGTMSAVPMDCTTGSLADYLALPMEGCNIGGKTFLEFMNPGVLSGAVELSPGVVTVTPLFDLDREGLLFTYDAAAASGMALQSIVMFRVQSNTNGIGAGALRLSGSSAVPDGVAVVSSDLCPDGFTAGLCDGPSTTLITVDDGVAPFLFDSGQFPAVFSLDVRHDAVIDGGLGGAAALGSAELRFTTVPEPASAAIVLIGLIGGGWLAHRRKRGAIGRN